MPTSKFFDLHSHPLLKQMLTRFDFCKLLDDDKKIVDLLTQDVEPSKKLIRILDDLVLKFFDSQTSIDQIETGGPEYVVANIVPVELAISDSTQFGLRILQSKLLEPIDRQYFKSINGGEISYLNLLLRELRLYKELSEKKKFKILNREETSTYISGLKIILAIEGGHSLSSFMIGNATKKDPLKGCLFIQNKKVIESLNKGGPVGNLKTLAEEVFKAGMDIFYLTLTHLSHIPEQHLATHAYGSKLIKHPAMLPQGHGITETGKEVVEAAYHIKHGENSRPILIDIKHMSLQSRLDLYDLRKVRGWNEIPILATHMGITGYSIKEWRKAAQKDRMCHYRFNGVRAIAIDTEPKYIGRWGKLVNTKFFLNPWSINLMDEDIIEVLKSKGLIGLNLDQRILGFQNGIKKALTGTTTEYLSRAEFSTHFPHIDISSLPLCVEDDVYVESKDLESKLLPTKKERQALYLCFNLLHIYVVGKLSTEVESDPLNHICIGTDFDGLIDPINICENVTELSQLSAELKRWLPIAAKSYQEENGGSDKLYGPFTEEKELAETVSKILYHNGVKFIQKKWPLIG